MQCKNHPAVPASGRCTGCADAFCASCLVEIHGQPYCGSCKVMTLRRGGPPQMPRQPRETCKEAREALTYAIIGLFCCAIIVEPIALIRAAEARKTVAANPSLGGEGLARAATTIAILSLLFLGLGFLGQVIALSQQL